MPDIRLYQNTALSSPVDADIIFTGNSTSNPQWIESKTTFAQAKAYFLSATPNAFYFGGGTDGNLTISSGTTTLTRDTYYNNVTISGTAQIVTNGFRLFISGTLDLINASANAITANGGNGGNGSGQTGGNGYSLTGAFI